MRASELIDCIVAVEATQARVFLATEWCVWLVVDRDVVDVGYARNNTAGEPQTTIHVIGEHGAR